MNIRILLPALLGLSASLPALAADAMPALQPLAGRDIPAGCGCSFGTRRGEPLLVWSWEEDKQYAYLREAEGGVRKLRLYDEKYFPAQHEPPRPGDRMALMFSYARWNVETASQVTKACSPKARTCAGTDYGNMIVLRWSGRQRTELRGWGHCGCPAVN